MVDFDSQGTTLPVSCVISSDKSKNYNVSLSDEELDKFYETLSQYAQIGDTEYVAVIGADSACKYAAVTSDGTSVEIYPEGEGNSASFADCVEQAKTDAE